MYKKKVEKLTFHGGRVYQAGETITFAGVEAAVAAGHYGDKLPEPKAEPAPAPAAPAAPAGRRAASAPTPAPAPADA